MKIEDGNHYEITSAELAKWLEAQKNGSWWSIDGDPLLTGRLSVPCPVDELGAELRVLDRTLVVQADANDAEAKGQLIDAGKLDAAAAKLATAIYSSEPLDPWANDRCFYLKWKGSPNEWLLCEDSETAAQFRDGAVGPN